jgi:hypothetical protein
MSVGPRPDTRSSIPVVSLNSFALTRQPPDVTDGLGLPLEVGEESSVVAPLQPLVDEGPEDDLKAHGELERGHRLPHNDPDLVHDVLGEGEEDFGHRLRHNVIYLTFEI